MAIKIEIKGAEKLKKYFIELPKRMDRELDKTNLNFMRRIRKSAKLRAPRDTNQLAESIKILPTKVKGKTKQYVVRADSPHAIYQELGFRPHFAYIRNSAKLPPGIYFVKKSTSFLGPAIDSNIVFLGENLNRAAGRAIQ